MSAIHEGPRLIGPFRKQHTKVKAIIHSHNRPEPYDISDDVFNCTTGKNIKGVGQANLACVPRINYLNHIGPNDYVNIYFDKSDGHGWVRTFFGLVDRVEEGFEVTEEGPRTVYYIICSDFTKIFEKTEYYTNESWHTEDSFFNNTIGSLLPGVAIRSQGLLIHGGPAELVSQIIFALLGFSQQFTLPDSYVSAIQNTAVIDENRQLRINTAEAVMSAEQLNALGDTGARGLLDRAAKNSANQAYGLESPPSAENDRAALTSQVAQLLRVDIDQVDSMRAQNPANFSRLLAQANVSQELYSLQGSEDATNVATRTNSVNTILRGASPATAPTALDLINIGSFVERETMDGFTFNSSIPNYHGSIINLLRQHSNDIVNELFFDLRPISATGSGIAEGCQWSTDPDELAGNIDTAHGSPGVKYVPSVIMRENPFSTISEVDATNVTIGLREPPGPGGEPGELLQYNLFPIGAIFSNKPNTPGRHVISFPNINAVDKSAGRSTPGKKHLDVAVISTDDIVKTSFGRSDTDHFNITAIISQSFASQSAQHYMKDLSPLVTPLHIQRHGLRVRILSARFDRLHESSNQGQTPTAQPNQPPTTQTVPEQAPVTPASGTWHPPCIVTQPHPVPESPYPVLHADKTHGTRWGYVRDLEGGGKRMHNGIDIYGVIGTPITAIADGVIVNKYANGEQNIYGNTLVIKHPGRADDGTDLYSVYAHLGRPRTVGDSTTPNLLFKARQNASEGFAMNQQASPSVTQVVGASFAVEDSPIIRAIPAGWRPNGVGVSGANIRRWLPTAKSYVRGHTGKTIVLEMGGNAVPTVEQVQTAHAEMTALLGVGGEISWVLPPIWPRTNSRQVRIADDRDEAAANIVTAGVPLLSTTRFTALASHLSRDNAHLNPEGGRAFVESWGLPSPPAGTSEGAPRLLAVGDTVQAGQIIGYMGWTAGRSTNRRQVNSGLGLARNARIPNADGTEGTSAVDPDGVHLHFEITKATGESQTYFPSTFGNGSYQKVASADVDPQVYTAAPFHRNNEEIIPALCSIEPYEFLKSKGVDLLATDVMDRIDSSNAITTQILADGVPVYTYTDEDRLWLARMLFGESGTNEAEWGANLWALAQRFVDRRRQNLERTMVELVTQFSQPINPDWYRNGSQCAIGSANADDDGCSESAMQRRDRLRQYHWQPAQLTQELLTIDKFLRGEIPNPVPGATNWHTNRLADGYVQIAPQFQNVFQGRPSFTTVVTLAQRSINEGATELNAIEPGDEQAPDQAAVTEAAGVENQATADSTRQANSTQTSGTSIDSPATRNLLARWLILQDHWYQHNLEYLSGDITLSRGAPEIRVGYRLDITDRNLSFYVESVSHTWQHPGALKTTLKVTRGQPNNPFPAYILPRNSGFGSGENQRFEGSRLGKYFIVPDPIALKRAKVFRQGYDGVRAISSPDTNKLDTQQELMYGSEKYILPTEFTVDDVELSVGEVEIGELPAEGSVTSGLISQETLAQLNLSQLQAEDLLAVGAISQLPIDGTNTNELYTEVP